MGLPTIEEILEAPPPAHSEYDLMVELPDGRMVVDTGDGYYLPKDDGWPDWDRPVHIQGMSRGAPKDGAEIIELPGA